SFLRRGSVASAYAQAHARSTGLDAAGRPSSGELLWNRWPCYSDSGDRPQAIVCRSVSGRSTLRKLAVLTIGAVALLGVALAPPDHIAWSQAARTIRVIISVPPGGSIDLLVRILSDYISSAKGQSIIVESRPGAGGIIAAEAVARAPPDGGTLLINNNGMIISSILRKGSHDPQTSFEPICYLVTTPQVIVVHHTSPYRTLAELVDAARARPGELSIASVGPNTTQHIGIERFKRLAQADLIYVPY